jgi:hypothetical protein
MLNKKTKHCAVEPVRYFNLFQISKPVSPKSNLILLFYRNLVSPNLFGSWCFPKSAVHNTSTQTSFLLLITLTTIHEKRSLPHHAIPFQLLPISFSFSSDISSALCSHNHPNLRSIKHHQSTFSPKTRIFLCLIKHHMTNSYGGCSIAPRIF